MKSLGASRGSSSYYDQHLMVIGQAHSYGGGDDDVARDETDRRFWLEQEAEMRESR
jgi:hypothetical protein